MIDLRLWMNVNNHVFDTVVAQPIISTHPYIKISFSMAF